MKCPRDGATLARVEILGLELDKCHECDGIWFDRGELERVRDAKIDGIEEVIEKKYGNPKVEEDAVQEHMRCPCCGDARLMRSTYTYLNPVSIDRCERCMGVWVDDGELDAIVGERKKLDHVESASRLKVFLRIVARAAGGRKR